MSYMTYKPAINQLYPLQDTVLAMVYAQQEAWEIEGVILCGGTALARCFLNHRVSYDLDFFIPHGFSAERLLQKTGKDGLILEDLSVEDGNKYVTQIHGYVKLNEERIKVSFVQDIYDGMWETVKVGGIWTEKVQSLYHRKLRTVTGSGYGENTQGERQNARDLFDLFVLHNKVERLSSFVKTINLHGANLPVAPLCANIIAMPWISLMDEFDRLVISGEYQNISFYRDIRDTLVNEAIILQKGTSS